MEEEPCVLFNGMRGMAPMVVKLLRTTAILN